ncbi:MAG: hypothetical protein GY845_22790 [Planctomycetes bacterium]|nr:hypothetical protein [Planctomycetota bacterium]
MYRKLFLFVLALSLVAANITFASNVVEIGITGGNDSIEEQAGGNMSMGSSDLELPNDGGIQAIGLRFLNVELPQGANIIEAYIVFTVDEIESDEAANLIIQGELVPDAPAFQNVDGNVRDRGTTNAVTKWSPEHYPTVGEKVQTADISAVIKEIIDQAGWVTGNALAIIINDDPDNPSVGHRTVESGSGAPAALLHVKYSSKFAILPDPANGSYYPDTWASLGWTPGDTAASSDLYFSDNLADVEASAEAAFQGNQGGAYFVVGFPGMPFPDGLVPGITYYWRVDSIEADGTTKYEGKVWSFTVPPKTAYEPVPADGAEAVDTDDNLSWTTGFGAILHTVYFGDNFDDVNNAAGGLPLGATSYDPGPLEMAKTYYWRVDELEPPATYKGGVWSFTTVGAVQALDPVNGAVDVSQTPTLTWTPGVFADTHEAYFGSDAASLELKSSGNLGSESFEPGQLEWNTTYYWRVDEANSTNANSPWTGNIWSFTTANFLIIDDMESYNDLDEADPESNRIYLAWIDGFGDPTNGSLVGYVNPPFAEQSNVHSGNQSMPLEYDNTAGKSEATLTLTSNKDWTVKGVDTLTIWYRGNASNSAETMYVMLNGSANVDNDNPDAVLAAGWTEWNIPLQAFADQGVNLTNVNSITLGLKSGAGGTGMIFVDDVRLYPPAP